MTFKRLDKGGRIDRSKPVTFRFNGGKLKGFAGDTLASALLANNKVLLGRSFKYHRPRGLLAAGVEEPNALFTTGKDGSEQANSIGPALELIEGLRAKSQNAWPSTRLDLRSGYQLFSRFLGAGFYYKTFMGPAKKSWMFYEPKIRKAAGLGKTTTQGSSQRHDQRHEFCDLLIVGSGPAGLSAAYTAAQKGLRVTLVEQDFEWGGSILNSADPALDTWRENILGELEKRPGLRMLKRATVQGIYDGNLAVIALEGKMLEHLRAKAIIFATGAIERPLVFENNDRPGIMLASALQAFANRFALVPRGRVIIATNNNAAYGAAFDLAQAGATVIVADERKEISGAVLKEAASHGVATFANTRIAAINGKSRLESVKLDGPHPFTLKCETLGISGGLTPLLHLTTHLGAKPVYEGAIAAFVPGQLASSQFAAGACAGKFGLARSIASGAEQARAALKFLGVSSTQTTPEVKGLASDHEYAVEAAWPSGKSNKAFVDFQNDVTVKDIAQAKDEGYSNVEHLKRYTTLGMGTDQGKTSNVNALAMMAGLTGAEIAATGTTTFRPPFTPFTIGQIVGRSVGQHFRPTRRSPLHDWHEKNGATMIEAGLWKRAWYYAWAGNSPQEAYLKEMELVRHNVGISDVSTLGKIAVLGKDAAEFLDRVYVNNFSTLEVGKSRYGVMLNDDGLVLDDGTTSRIRSDEFYLTTTTAQAGEVMSWLEYLLQCHWTNLQVHVTSLTDEWGGFAVSGPNARKALEAAFPRHKLDNDSLPYMGVKDTTFEETPMRIMRLSFSGELGYEIHCPANYTQSLWEHVLKAAEPFGIKPYGLEALASLRIEKGHVAGMELDHRNSLDDLGLGKMAAKKKSFIGEVLRKREDLMAPERWSLVGLEPTEPGKTMRGGAILFAADDKIEGHGRGYITSVTYSTDLQTHIALGLYKGGLKHENQEIIAVFPLKNEQIKLRIVSPHFIDRNGTRLHA